jgi:hypothetical protein
MIPSNGNYGYKLRFIPVKVEPSGIDEIGVSDNLQSDDSQIIYDLQGRKLAKSPTHGVVIINGKKILIK